MGDFYMRIIFIITFLVTVGIVTYASGEYDSVIYTKKSNIAVEGYDTVSFFANTHPQEGVRQRQTE